MRLKTKALFANAVVLTERALAELKCDGCQPEIRIREATSLQKTLQCDIGQRALSWSGVRRGNTRVTGVLAIACASYIPESSTSCTMCLYM